VWSNKLFCVYDWLQLVQSVGSYCGGYVPGKVSYVQEFTHKETLFPNSSVARPSSRVSCILIHFIVLHLQHGNINTALHALKLFLGMCCVDGACSTVFMWHLRVEQRWFDVLCLVEFDDISSGRNERMFRRKNCLIIMTEDFEISSETSGHFCNSSQHDALQNSSLHITLVFTNLYGLQFIVSVAHTYLINTTFYAVMSPDWRRVTFFFLARRFHHFCKKK
jgi:hypothetical protein